MSEVYLSTKKWNQCDKFARSIIGLSHFDDMFEHVHKFATAKEMLPNIKNVFRRKTTLNKPRARRDFYTVEMKKIEKTLACINGVQ